MTAKAKELLVKMASQFDSTHKNDFDSLFYFSFPDSVINELESLNCIVKQNDIVGTVKLTLFGYEEAKK